MRYFLRLRFDAGANGAGAYQIIKLRNGDNPSERERVVFSRPYIDDEELGEYMWPADVRRRYEELTGKMEFSKTTARHVNIVPMLVADDDEVAYDCPCIWAQHVKDHAVYCENDGWLYAPRKCRRDRGSSNSTHPQETCPGFKPNPNYAK